MWMIQPSLSKYDYGWIRDGGVAWTMAGAGYYGPPHSLWWTVLAFALFRILFWAGVATALGMIHE